jgi:ethanolaminephosphotransferase
VLLCCQAINLGRSWWTVSSIVATTANFYLTTWEEYHTGNVAHYFVNSVLNACSGQLFLGVFSGPVEGILMIVGMFAITGWKGWRIYLHLSPF